jgi:hypothetical protein
MSIKLIASFSDMLSPRRIFRSGTNTYGLHLILAILALTWLSVGSASADCRDYPGPGVDWSGCSKSRRLMAEYDFRGAKLQSADLSDTDLSGANLSKANLSDATMLRTRLVGANMREANLTKAVLDRADLPGVDLSGADASKAELHRTNISEATGPTSAMRS